MYNKGTHDAVGSDLGDPKIKRSLCIEKFAHFLKKDGFLVITLITAQIMRTIQKRFHIKLYNSYGFHDN